jgi:putative peptide maturation system protein
MTEPTVEPSRALVDDAVALLVRLRTERASVDAAWAAILELRERHPGRSIELVWERESYSPAIHYDILLELAAGTLSVSYCADEEVPWPTRGLQRVSESLVLRVNGDPVHISQVVTSLDYAWQQLHIGRHLIDMSLIDQEIRNRKIELSDEQLAAALDEFRRARRLFAASSVEQWMAEHGLSPAQLENHLRQDVARRELRRQVVGGPQVQAARFAANPERFERIQVARIFLTERDAADALAGELGARPQQFLAAAQRQFLTSAASREVFATWWRGELDAADATALFATEPGQIAPVLASGGGFEVVQVLRRLGAVLDDETRTRIDDQLFDGWLAERRARARVEWFWGAAEAAEVPAISL